MKNDTIKQLLEYFNSSLPDLVKYAYWKISTQSQFTNNIKKLIKLISSNDTMAAEELNRAHNKLYGCYSKDDVYIHCIPLGRICGVFNILSNKYCDMDSDFNIFISHSSKDKEVIEKFIEKILRLGCAIDRVEIFCTSIEDMSIKTGDDIRKHIKKTMLGCDYIFLMISENYVRSPMCLNEMGASWITDKKVKPFLFPPLAHDAIWLSEVIKNNPINNGDALDCLRDELVAYTGKTGNTSDWNKQKEYFINYFNQLQLNNYSNTGQIISQYNPADPSLFLPLPSYTPTQKREYPKTFNDDKKKDFKFPKLK